jgi:hypothetical protein
VVLEVLTRRSGERAGCGCASAVVVGRADQVTASVEEHTEAVEREAAEALPAALEVEAIDGAVARAGSVVGQ